MTRTKKSILLVALSLILVATCGFSLYNYKSNNVTAVGNLTFEGSIEINEEYTYGDELNIPGAARIEVGDQFFDSSSAVVIAPDGSVLKTGKVVLDQIGYYTARYYYQDARNTKYEQYKFLVAQEKYNMSSENSSAEYIADLSDTANSGTYMFEDYENSTSAKRITDGVKINDAIRVTLNENDTFTYNTPIKLNQDGITNVVTFCNNFGIKSSEPLKDSQGNPLYDLYELETNADKYLDGGLKMADDGTILWDELVWKEGVNKPYMYEDNKPGAYYTYFRITDAYDPYTYIELMVRSVIYNEDWNYYPELGSTYHFQDLAAGFNGSAHYGLDRGNNADRPDVMYNGERYDAFVQTVHDYAYYKPDGVFTQNRDNVLVQNDGTRVPWGGENPDAWCYKGQPLIAQKRTYITFQYDIVNNNVCYSINNLSGNSTMLMNLDIADAFDGKTFEGFSSDEVILSVYAKDIANGTITTDIVDIAGTNLDPNAKTFVKEVYDNDGNLTETLRYKDSTAPLLDVNYTPSYAGRVYAAVGCEFPIFSTNARDVNLDKVVSEVYYGYVDETNKGTLVFSDGKTFMPKQAGIYTIVYKALDRFGNTTLKTVEVLAINTTSGKLLDLALTQADFDAITAKAGETVNLPESKTAINGINGNTSYTIKAVYLANGEEIVVNDDHFTPLYAGAWKIVYEISDAVTSAEYSFNLTVGSNDKVGYAGVPTLPKYLIGGAKYSFEDFDFYTFTSSEGREEADYTINVSYDGGATYTVFNDGDAIDSTKTSAVIKYESGDAAYVSAPIEIIDVGYGENITKNNPFVEGEYGWDIRKYFKTNNIVVNSFKTFATFNVVNTTNDGSFDFIKEISASNFMLEFRSSVDDTETSDANEGTGKNFSNLEITLTDFYNPSIKTVISLITDSAGTQLVVDGKTASVRSSSVLVNSDSILRYSLSNKAFYLGADVKIQYELPFTSDKVYVSFALKGVNGDAGIAITSLINQKLGNLRNDSTNTMISLDVEKGNRKMGDLLVIKSPDVVDVLSPVLRKDVEVKVVSPTKSEVKTVDGIVLSGDKKLADRAYEVELKEYGNYIITFFYKDQLGIGTLEYSRTVSVVETEAPTIVFKDGSKVGITIDVPVGRPVVLKAAIVTDNVDTNPRLTVFVGDRHMNLNIVALNSSGNRVFTPLEEGLYRITYRAADATGNSSIIYYYLNVVK